MKAIITRFIFLLTVILSSEHCFSQIDTATYYLDASQRLSVKEKAVYMAKGIKENDKFKISYFVLATGKLVLEIMYTDFTLTIMDGPYVQYDENGKIAQKGNYSNNKKEGYWTNWNFGHLTDSVFYVNGLDSIRISFAYNEKGTLYTRTLNDSTTKTSEVTAYDDEGKIVRNAKWIDGNGEQVYYYPTGQVKTIEKYKDNKIVSTKNYDPDGSDLSENKSKKKEEKTTDSRDMVVGEEPSYPGGKGGFDSFFKRNFKRPAMVGRQLVVGPQGVPETVTVTFYLDKAGFATNIQVSGTNNRDVEAEVKAVFRRMAAWNMNGRLSFGPITYTLNF